MNVVLDCNVIISAGLTDGICRKIFSDVLRNHTLYVSDPILSEYKEIINRKKFSSHYDNLKILIQCIEEISILVDLTPIHEINLPDPDDIIYIDTANTVKPSLLITGNIKHFPKHIDISIIIISPREYSDRYMLPIPELSIH